MGKQKCDDDDGVSATQKANNKGTNRFGQMRRLVCAFVVRKPTICS